MSKLLVVKGGVVYGLVGLLIGTFNGVFALDPENSHRPALFSFRDGAGGLLLAIIIWYFVFIIVNLPSSVALQKAGLLALASGIAASLWKFLTWKVPSGDTTKPPLFSLRGFVVGLIVALVLGFFSAVLADLSVGVTFTNSLRGAVLASLIIGIGGGITGGISRYIFWRALHLRPNELGAIGVILTLIGFISQLIPPMISILN